MPGVSKPKAILKVGQNQGLPLAVQTISQIGSQDCPSCKKMGIFISKIPETGTNIDWRRFGTLITVLHDSCVCDIVLFVLDPDSVHPLNIDALRELNVEVVTSKKNSQSFEDVEESVISLDPDIAMFYVLSGGLGSSALSEIQDRMKSILPNTKTVVLSDRIELDSKSNSTKITYLQQHELLSNTDFAVLLSEAGQLAHRTLFPNKPSGVLRYLHNSERNHVNPRWSSRSGILIVGRNTEESRKAIDSFIDEYLLRIESSQSELPVVNIVGDYPCTRKECCKCVAYESKDCSILYHGKYDTDERLLISMSEAGISLSLEPDSQFSTENLLAFESGLPIISFGSILDGSCYNNGASVCQFCPDHDYNCLFNTLLNVYNDESVWESIAEANKIHLKDSFRYGDLHHDVSHMMEKLENPIDLTVPSSTGPFYVYSFSEYSLTFSRLLKLFSIIDVLNAKGQVFVSILDQENSAISRYLNKVAEIALEARGIQSRIVVGECHDFNDIRCISSTFLSIFQEMGDEYNNVVVLGSNIPLPQTVMALLDTDTEYDMACGMQFSTAGGEGIKFEGVAHTRSFLGDVTSSDYPFFTDTVSNEILRQKLPIRVYACWSDLVVFKARSLVSILPATSKVIECDSSLGMFLGRNLWQNGATRVFLNPAVAISTQGLELDLPNEQSDKARQNKMMKSALSKMKTPSRILCCPSQGDGCYWNSNREAPFLLFEGSYVGGQYSHVFSGEVGLRIAASERIDMGAVIDVQEKLDIQDWIGIEFISRVVSSESPVTLLPKIYVRSKWPIDWNRPKECPPGSCLFVMVQTWNYGYIPNDWVTGSRNVDHIIVPSTLIKQGYIKSGILNTKIHVIPFGFHTKHEPLEGKPEDSFSLPPATFKFLFHGNLDPSGGLDLLIQDFFDEFMGQENVCLIIHSAPSAGYDAYARLIERAVDNALKFSVCIKWIRQDSFSQSETRQIFALSDVLVLPRRTGNENTVMAAASLKLPIITTQGGLNMPKDAVYFVESQSVPCQSFPCSTSPSVVYSNCRSQDDCDYQRVAGPPYWMRSKSNSVRHTMRSVYNDDSGRLERVEKAYAFAHENFSWNVVSSRFVDKILSFVQ